MQHQDHVRLLQQGIAQSGGTWADLGAGTGAFTLALADLLGPGATIYAIDTDQRALNQLKQSLQAQFPQTQLSVIPADFTRELHLPPLDGIVMANSLHYVRKKDAVLQHLRGYLRPGGHLLLVEYNADRGNMWVPYPLSYPNWERLAQQNGFQQTHLLARVPSRFLQEIYSACSLA